MRRGALPSIVKPPLFLSPDNNLVSERERVYRVMAFQLSFFVSHFFLSLLRAVS